jgi:uncharacterized protein (DUF1778 family)
MAITAKEERKRVTARIPNEMRDTLERAAELVGGTVNQFVMHSAYQEAQRILQRESIIRLSQAEAKVVFSLIDNPPPPRKKLAQAIKAAKKLVRV